MAIDFNHTIVWARDSEESATFLSQVLGVLMADAHGRVGYYDEGKLWT